MERVDAVGGGGLPYALEGIHCQGLSKMAMRLSQQGDGAARREVGAARLLGGVVRVRGR